MAAEEARLSVDQGGGPFGAVIVQVDDETGADRPGVRARQATIATSRDALNLWKRSEIVPY